MPKNKFFLPSIVSHIIVNAIRERLHEKNAKFDDKTFASSELSVLSISKIKNVDTSSIDTATM